MNAKSTTLERVKDGMDDVVEKAREVFNDGLDAAKDRFDHAAKRLDRRYRRASGQLRDQAKVMRSKLAQTKEAVASGYDQVTRKVARLDRGARRYVSHNPRKAVLIAAGVGLLAGLVLSRSRRAPVEG